jgi:benzoylsuccinyl-CoA thiolase BbsB subunit
MVSPPIHLLEAAPWSDGACAVIVASSAWADANGVRGPAVTGWGEAHSPTSFLPFGGDVTRFSWIGEATREALSAAGRGIDDVDVAEIYGPFATSELMTYEAMGFFRPGEAPRAVTDGRTTYGGDVVIDPSGGRICMGHPPPATPLYEIEELFLQLTERAGDRQVNGAMVGVAQAEHGAMNGASVAVLEA